MGKTLEYRNIYKDMNESEIKGGAARYVLYEMLKLSPAELADFVEAVKFALQYIDETQQYYYFTEPTHLTALIGVKYDDLAGQHRPPAEKRPAGKRTAARKTVARAEDPKKTGINLADYRAEM